MGLHFSTPNHDSLDALVPQFEPKLKVPKLIHDKPSDNLVSQPDVSSFDFTKPLFMVGSFQKERPGLDREARS